MPAPGAAPARQVRAPAPAYRTSITAIIPLSSWDMMWQ